MTGSLRRSGVPSVTLVTVSECRLCLLLTLLIFGGKTGGIWSVFVSNCGNELRGGILGLYPGNLINSSVMGNGNSSGLFFLLKRYTKFNLSGFLSMFFFMDNMNNLLGFFGKIWIRNFKLDIVHLSFLTI